MHLAELLPPDIANHHSSTAYKTYFFILKITQKPRQITFPAFL